MTPTERAEKIVRDICGFGWACKEVPRDTQNCIDQIAAQIEEAERAVIESLGKPNADFWKKAYAEGFRAGEESGIVKSEKSFITGFNAARAKAKGCIPTNWFDELLTGKDAPKDFNGKGMDQVLKQIAQRIDAMSPQDDGEMEP